MSNREIPGERLKFGKNAAESIDEYWKYTR